MSTFLPRRKPVCFYCGCRSAQSLRNNLRKWECEKCEAVNHLDENGEITDPPTSGSSSAVQYAVNNPRPSSPLASSAGDNLFCATCLKNQHLLTHTLASYLPPTNHPEYASYEAAYPTYRDSLEERYPQVCVECEPRVRDRIRAAGYHAKTDHVRRMLERTRKGSGGAVLSTWVFQEVLVLIGGLSWFASMIGYSVWCLTRAINLHEECDELTSNGWTSMTACFLRPFLLNLDRWIQIDQVARYSLLLGLLSIWWNNRQLQKLRGSGSHLAGLTEYYQLQVVVILVRTAVWWGLQDGRPWTPAPSAQSASYLFMLGFILVTTIISLRIVKINHQPKITFHADLKPLRAGPSIRRQPIPEPYYSPSVSRSIHDDEDNSPAPSFKSERLSSTPATPRLFRPHENPPTPPPDSVDGDAMDWTPTQRAFQIRQQTPVRTPETVVAGPSFSTYQRLPAAPKSMAARIRNPPDPTPYFKSAGTKQQEFFQSSAKMTAKQSRDGRRAEGNDAEGNGYIDMAPPRFFPQIDEQSDTGLEGLFDATFTLGEEPPELANVRNRGDPTGEPNGTQSFFIRFISLFLFTAALIA